MKARDLRELTDDELRQRMRERAEALNAFRMQMVTGAVDNVRGARNARRDIARIKTILHQRELTAAGPGRVVGGGTK
ncbi:MAG: 50S ribosomal protein L29 [Candidatus Hydrogenedentes bacterium]|nr:50S ribosomal protein L29 [Candidatus Hydrogenedentota bacterium]